MESLGWMKSTKSWRKPSRRSKNTKPNWRLQVKGLRNWKTIWKVEKDQFLNRLHLRWPCMGVLDHLFHPLCPEGHLLPQCPVVRLRPLCLEAHLFLLHCPVAVLHRLLFPEWVVVLVDLHRLLFLEWEDLDLHLRLVVFQDLVLRRECQLRHPDRIFFRLEWNPRRNGNWTCL